MRAPLDKDFTVCYNYTILTINYIDILNFLLRRRFGFAKGGQKTMKKVLVIAAHPDDAAKLLAERDAALKEFAEKDWPRLENTFTPEFITRMRSWLKLNSELSPD